MTRTRRRRIWSAAAIALLCIVAAGWWQRQALARLGVIAAVEGFFHVRLSFDRSRFALNHAVIDGIAVTSFRGEPIAEISRLELAYDLRDLLPGAKRRFGLESIAVYAPALTVIRRADGSYNLPLPNLSQPTPSGGAPLNVRARVRNGSIEIVDESPAALANRRHLYVRDLNVDATLATAARSSYVAALRYGERADRLYPVRGTGTIDSARGYVEQHWSAPELPIAAAVNFLAGSSAMRLQDGMLENVDARSFGLRGPAGSLQTHLGATAWLADGRIAIAGLAKPIENMQGRIDAYDDGLLTSGLTARLAAIPLQISGGLYGLRAPRLRVAVRGRGSLTQLRTALAQAQRLPIRGSLDFSMLVAGAAPNPVTWIALRSPKTEYAATTLEDLHGVVALTGHEADVVGVNAAYGRVRLGARGRIAFDKERNAVELLAGASAPSGGTPYVSRILPDLPLRADVLATADDPKAIAMRGLLSGRSASRRLEALFDVDSRGVGTVGPLEIDGKSGSLYARVALDHPHGSAFGIVETRNFAFEPLRARLDATIFGDETNNAIETIADAKLRTLWGSGSLRGNLAFAHGALKGAFFGNAANAASYGATVGGSPNAPRIAGTIVVAGGRFRNFNVNGSAGLLFDRNALDIQNAEVALGPLFLGVTGGIDGIVANRALAPRYDLAAQVHSSDVSALVATVRPHAAQLVQGSVDAAVHLGGSGAGPVVSGTFDAPEGSINGLSFRDFRSAVDGDVTALAVRGGRVVVGGSAIALNATATRAGDASFSVSAPHLDLADLNDFFDRGDMLGGTGSLALRADVSGRQIAATAGSAHFTGARVRRIELGSVSAHWSSAGQTISSALQIGGPSGELALTGSVTPNAKRVDLHAGVRALDLATWLPMLGLRVPVTGKLDAQTDVAGTYPDLDMRLHAAVFGGTAGRIAVERFEVSAVASHGRGTITSATLDLPYLTSSGSGTFGLRPGDPLALALHSTSPDIGEFLARAGEKRVTVHGSLDSTLRIEGTRERPRLNDAIGLQSLRYRGLELPHVAADIEADRRAVDVRDGEIDFTKGRALFAAHVPIRMNGSKLAVAGAPFSASLTAGDVELSNFVDLLPKGTRLSGRVDGRVEAYGTLDAPRLHGSLALQNGTFAAPAERSPITGISGELSLDGNHGRLQSQASVGGGTVTANAIASLADLRRPADATFAAYARARNARLDLPAYFQGRLDGEVALTRNGAEPTELRGDLSVADARIPLNSLLNQRGTPNARPALPNVAFRNVRLTAGSNVRVQSANVDIGTTGAVLLGGTLDAPTLAGAFRSTGGSLSFYRNFYVERGQVRFEPSSGVVPDVDAVATTFVPNPATAVRLHVTGPVTDMNLALASEPSYDRAQILGLLVGAQQFGAVRGVQASGGGTFSAGSAASGVALGQLNTVFTRTLLEPLSTSLGSTLGFTEVQITSDIQTGLGVNAVKAFGKYVNAIYAQSFGYPRTQSVGLEAHPNVGSALRLTAYTSTGPTLFALQQQPQPIAFGVLNLNPLTAYTPITGTNGVSFSYQRMFP